MTKQKIGVLFSRAWKRSCDWKLNVFILLLSLIFYAPAGAVTWWRYFYRAGRAWTKPSEIAYWIVTTAVFSWLIGMLGLAGMREIVRQETSLRRGFASILPGWSAALTLVPWILLLVLPGCAAMHWQSEMMAEYEVLAGVIGWTIIPLTLFSLCMFMLLAAGRAAASTGTGALYRNAFRAFRRGWGRWLIALLILYPASVAASLVLVPLGFAIDHSGSLWLGILLFIPQGIIFNWFMIFLGSVSAALYAEAAEASAAPDEPEPPQPSVGE